MTGAIPQKPIAGASIPTEGSAALQSAAGSSPVVDPSNHKLAEKPVAPKASQMNAAAVQAQAHAGTPLASTTVPGLQKNAVLVPVVGHFLQE